MDAEETRLYYLVWIAAVLLGIILWYFFRVMTGRLSKNKEELEQQLDAQVALADEGRMQFAVQLHNDVQPLLTSLGRKIEMLKMDPPKPELILEEADLLIRESLLLTRDLTKLVLPYRVTTTSLPVAIRDMVNRLHEKPELLLEHNELPMLEAGFLLGLCRLLQEIIYNSIKHSRAGGIRIVIGYHGNQLTIRTAEKDRLVTTLNQKNEQAGIGMDLMKSRIRLLKGTMHRHISEEEGTRYVITIPLNPHQIVQQHE